MRIPSEAVPCRFGRLLSGGFFIGRSGTSTGEERQNSLPVLSALFFAQTSALFSLLGCCVKAASGFWRGLSQPFQHYFAGFSFPALRCKWCQKPLTSFLGLHRITAHLKGKKRKMKIEKPGVKLPKVVTPREGKSNVKFGGKDIDLESLAKVKLFRGKK